MTSLVPGLGVALALGRIMPADAWYLYPLGALLAHVMALRAAALRPMLAPASPRAPSPITVILELRRAPLRHAAGFALVTLGFATVAVQLTRLLDHPMLLADGPAATFGYGLVLFAVGAALIALAAFDPGIVGRALKRENGRAAAAPGAYLGKAAAARASASMPAQFPAITSAFGATQLPPTQSVLDSDR